MSFIREYSEGFSEPFRTTYGGSRLQALPKNSQSEFPVGTSGARLADRSGIFPKVNPRSSIDVVRADESGTEGANLEFPKGILWRRSDCCAISTEDDIFSNFPD